jgi:hypothetical protein
MNQLDDANAEQLCVCFLFSLCVQASTVMLFCLCFWANRCFSDEKDERRIPASWTLLDGCASLAVLHLCLQFSRLPTGIQ